MTELQAWQWVKKCPGAEIYIGVQTVALYLEGRMFMGNDLISVVQQAIEAGF